jgi:hypothetical protein
VATPSTEADRTRALVRAQASYYGLTGAWPIVHRRSFEAVSGPKTDYWLVRMVGALTAATAVTLAVGARGEDVSPETRVLALTSAASFAAVDGYYGARRRISKVYLIDLFLQGCLIVLLLRLQRRQVAGRAGG